MDRIKRYNDQIAPFPGKAHFSEPSRVASTAAFQAARDLKFQSVGRKRKEELCDLAPAQCLSEFVAGAEQASSLAF